MTTLDRLNIAPLDDSAISINPSAAGIVSVDEPTGQSHVGSLPSSLDPLDDSDIATDPSAARPVSVDDVTIPSPPAVGMVILTVLPASLDPVKDTPAD